MANVKQPKPAWGTKVQALVQDSRNSISRDNAHAVARRKCEASVKHLESYAFWKGSGRAYRNLWAHQIGALELAAAYLAADRQLPREGNVPEASLIKMPTGTGKSGVIAILARCLPLVRRVLVLTPRTALADQLQRDVSFRFWQHLKCPAKNNSTYAAPAAAIGADLEGAQISKMLPSECEDLLKALKSADRFIAIGTFQALEQTRRDGIKHGKKSPERQLLDAMGTFDLVIVDEGHYEPAPA
jgi:hypothetical protein